MDGDSLADYEIHEEVGAGGMGAVYRATDRRIGRTVAVKMIRQDRLPSRTVRERFVREARSIGQLNHPNVATLYDVSLDDATPHIVMEYLPGVAAPEQRLQAGPMPVGELLRCASDLGLGLEHAHAHGVVHRDLKPGERTVLGRGRSEDHRFRIGEYDGGNVVDAAGHGDGNGGSTRRRNRRRANR